MKTEARESRPTGLIAAAVLLVALLVLSGIRPYDYGTWALEVAPVVIALPILLATYNRFPLTTLLYVLIFAHSVVLMVGGSYTYARVPLGFEIQQLLGLARNPYDKIGHFMQGFTPAGATEFLGTQGDPWDTQSDMFFALIGAVTSLLLLTGLQDRQIRALDSR